MPDKDKVVQSGTVPMDNSESDSEQSGIVNEQTGENKGTQESQSGTEDTNTGSQQSDSQDKGAETKSKDSDSESKDADTQGQQKDPSEMSTDELIKTLQESTQQTNEVNQKLNALLQSGENQQGEQQAPDYDAALQELEQQLANGDLNVDEFSSKQRQIMEKKISDQMNQVVESKMEEQEAKEATRKYLENNPDYPQYANSEAVQNMMQENPILDEVSAYERAKRVEAENSVAELQKQIDELKQQQENAAKNGAEVTDNVGKEPGSEIRQNEVQAEANKPTKQGMLDVLKQAQAQA